MFGIQNLLLQKKMKYFSNTKILILKECKCKIDAMSHNQYVIGERCILCNGKTKRKQK
jgi:hypothetical protein